MNFDVRATTTDRDPEMFHVTAATAEDAIASAESHLFRSFAWDQGDFDRGVIHVRPILSTDPRHAGGPYAR